jgi:hypothetical protein
VSRNSKNICEFTSGSTVNESSSTNQVIVDQEILAEAMASKGRIRERLAELASRFAGPDTPTPASPSEGSVDEEPTMRLTPLMETD